MYLVKTDGIEAVAEFDSYGAAMQYAEFLDTWHPDRTTHVTNAED